MHDLEIAGKKLALATPGASTTQAIQRRRQEWTTLDRSRFYVRHGGSSLLRLFAKHTAIFYVCKYAIHLKMTGLL
jgi:hypothetical protein